MIGPSKGSAILTLSPASIPMYEKLSGKQSNFAPAEAASFFHNANPENQYRSGF